MVDTSAFPELRGSLRSLAEITRAMKDFHDADLMQAKIFELTQEISTAQTWASEAQAAQSELLDRVRQLEDEKAKLEAWSTEKQRYELTSLAEGVTAYVLKPGTENGEPVHRLCTNCYAEGRKSILQTETRYPGRCEVMVCNRCGSELYVSGGREPQHNAMARKHR
jgi:hypothetical protein